MTSPGGPRGRRRREGWGRGVGSGDLALIYRFLRRLAAGRRLPPRATGLGCSSLGRRGEERGGRGGDWLFTASPHTPYTEQGN